MNKNLKPTIARLVFQFGYYPLVVAAKKFAENGETEMVSQIVQVVKEHCCKYNILLPQSLNDLTDDDYLNAFIERGHDGLIAASNLDSYVDNLTTTLNAIK